VICLEGISELAAAEAEDENLVRSQIPDHDPLL